MVSLNPILAEENTMKAFQLFKQNVHNAIQQGKDIDYRSFYNSLISFGDRFELQEQRHIMNCSIANFAENLASQKQYDLASIIYGILIKSNWNNSYLLEQFGLKGLAIAKKLNDPIHIMARADNLNQLYRATEYGSKKHLQALVEEEKALKTIVSNYDLARKNYKTIFREPLPFEHYEFMLCGIKMEIAKINIDSNPLLAINKLEEAQDIISKYGYGTITQRIQALLDKAYSIL